MKVAGATGWVGIAILAGVLYIVFMAGKAARTP